MQAMQMLWVDFCQSYNGLRLDNTPQGLHRATPVFWQYKIWYL